jgi:hypothetical protein
MRRNPVAAFVAAVGLCLIVSGVTAGVAKAEVRTVSWVHPTANTDGSPLPLAQISRTIVVWGTSSAMTNSKIVTGTATSTTIDLAPGTWFVGAKTTANNNDSAVSNVVQVVIPQPTPNPPVVTVQAVVAGLNMAPAFKILADGSRSSVIAGFVPVGTGCGGPVLFTYRKLGYRVVPRETVQWWNPPLADAKSPPPVAAPCA